MRFVAVLLLVVSALPTALASAGPSTGPAPLGSPSRRPPILAITQLDHTAPASPSRSEPAIESALDEQELNDLDPLDAPPRAVAADRFASARFESASPSSSPAPAIPRRRPGLLRC